MIVLKQNNSHLKNIADEKKYVGEANRTWAFDGVAATVFSSQLLPPQKESQLKNLCVKLSEQRVPEHGGS